MRLSHPYRYLTSFRAQLSRLERLYPGITHKDADVNSSSSLFEMEYAGASVVAIAGRNERLCHLERLIADWRADGEVLYAIEPGDLEAPSSSAVQLDNVAASVIYVELGHSFRLELSFQPRSRIEVFYIREIVSDGDFCAEITFVCDEPGWVTVDSCLYVDAMGVGSRISVGVVPLGKRIESTDVAQFFEGDPLLSHDVALLRSFSVVGAFIASGFFTATPALANAGRAP